MIEMEMKNLNILLKQIKEKEDRDNAYAKQIKESESIIKLEEENIKQLIVLKRKLTEDLEKKLIENSKQETTYEILQQNKFIWIDLLDKTRRELKEEEKKLDDLLRSICMNRVTFCENIKDFLHKNNFNSTQFNKNNSSFGFDERSVPLMTAEKKIKSEKDSDEINNLAEQIKNLETQLEEMTVEESHIEEAKLYKVRLQSEPSCGENFLRLQDSLKDIKDKLGNLETETKAVKSNIAQKELILLKRRNVNKNTEFKAGTSQGVCQKVQFKLHSNNDASSQNVEQKKAGMKTIQFKNSVEVKKHPSPQLKSILKCKSFTNKSSSLHLRKQFTEKLVLNLDNKMKEILFKNKE